MLTITRSENSPSPTPMGLTSTSRTASPARRYPWYKKHAVHHSAVMSSLQRGTPNGSRRVKLGCCGDESACAPLELRVRKNLLIGPACASSSMVGATGPKSSGDKSPS
eukprot:6181206-Pleurochrysis_carterae.AAC.4